MGDALGESAVHLAFHDQRIDLHTDVVDAHVLADRGLAGLGVDLDRTQVGSVRIGEVIRIDGGLRLQGRLDTIGQVVRAERFEGDSRERLGLLRITLDAEGAIDEFQVVHRAFQLVRGDDLGLLDESLGGLLDGLTTDGQRSRAIGVHAVGRATGVTVHDLDVLDVHAEDAGRDLAPRRLVSLSVRRGAGDQLDLAGGQGADRAVLPTASDVLQRTQGARRRQAAHLGERRDAQAQLHGITRCSTCLLLGT